MNSRRSFMKSATALGLGVTGLKDAFAHGSPGLRRGARGGIGELVADPSGLLDLPAGFEYRVFSTVGETMDDGFYVPPLHDGMAAFPGSGSETILVRNHEAALGEGGAFGPGNELLGQIERDSAYDLGYGKSPCLGGTTTLVYDTEAQELVSHHLSLAGTLRNCAGGPTPWGSWVSCEEAVTKAGETCEVDHGYCFEVPASGKGLAAPVPLKGMGRFNHEAIAVDPNSGVVFLTEDRPDSLFYRYVPKVPGKLAEGGELQALRFSEAASLDTRNWHDFTRIEEGVPYEARWVDLDEIDAPDDDLRYRGFLRGAARFARGEGMWFAGGYIYFACTIGGKTNNGQIWRYKPSEFEGARKERTARGQLELFVEPNDPESIDMCDNLTIAPWGDLMVCEDGGNGNRIVGITPDGMCYPFANNARDGKELAGATFSPDGSTLFVNMQSLGLTVAITGPWPQA